ncbi:hypothetical protein [Mycolicibacterium peregrinum]|uniref:hypothetical protein n=1 Tax=Mycolicibacterium peregrinum TaxID=43304 RepID=UPI003AAA46DA
MTKSRWPDTETQRLLALYDDGLTHQEIADDLGRPVDEVTSTLADLGERGFHSFWRRRLIAVHEAGHGVAVLMREGTLKHITAYPIDGANGRVSHGDMPGRGDGAFVAFAGQWAEARYRWEWDEIHEDDGAAFEDYLEELLALNTSDMRIVTRAADRRISRWKSKVVHVLFRSPFDQSEYERTKAQSDAKEAEVRQELAEQYRRWDEELEEVWPVINQVADMIQSGEPVTGETVRQLL